MLQYITAYLRLGTISSFIIDNSEYLLMRHIFKNYFNTFCDEGNYVTDSRGVGVVVRLTVVLKVAICV